MHITSPWTIGLSVLSALVCGFFQLPLSFAAAENDCVRFQTGNTQTVRHNDLYRVASISPDRTELLAVLHNGSVVRFPLLPRLYGANRLGIAMDSESIDVYVSETVCVRPSAAILDNNTTSAWLYRFSKPGGFEPEQHLSVLLGILNSQLVPDRLGLIQAALRGVLFRSDRLYEDLLRRYPEVAIETHFIDPHVSENEKAQLAEVAQRFLQRKVDKRTNQSLFIDWEYLTPLAPYLSELPEATKINLSKDIGESLARGAIQTERFKWAFESKLLRIAGQRVRQTFFETTESRSRHVERPLSDFSVLRKPGAAIPVIVGAYPIDGDRKTDTGFGFYAKFLPTVYASRFSQSGNILVNYNVAWSQGLERYTAKLHITEGAHEVYIPEGGAPAYAELNQDGAFEGAVVVGSTVGDYSQKLLGDILEFYKQRGYQFDEEGADYAYEEIDDIKLWLQEGIQSGQLDYLIKEAHSDGDDKNLMMVDRHVWDLRGTLKRSDGLEERIHLLFPHLVIEPDSPGSRQIITIPNDEFGSWVRTRESNGKGQLVYFNFSCSSTIKAVHEIEATRSKKLLDIPVLGDLFLFELTPTGASAQELLLSAFLRNETFDGFRNALTSNPGYQKGTQNVIVFPEHPGYDLIRETLQLPLIIRPIEVLDVQGQVVTIESGIQH